MATFTGTSASEFIIPGVVSGSVTVAPAGSDLNGDDTVNAKAGGDLVDGGPGDDTLDGGKGFDTVSYQSAGAGVTVTLSNLFVTMATGGGGTDTLSGFEGIDGSDFDDVLSGSTSFGATDGYTIDGFDGDDVIGGSSLADVLRGGDDDDTISGNGDDDTLTGDDGDDTLDGGAGDDLLFGDDGIDTASYASATAGVTVSLLLQDILGGPQDTIGAGIDELDSIEKLRGSNFADDLTGNTDENTVAGGDGDDVIDGSLGEDTLKGEEGDDVIYGGNGSDNDVLQGGLGNDELQGGLGDDTLNGNAGTADIASYVDSAGEVIVSLLLSGAAQNTLSAGQDTLLNIEGLRGSAFDDTLTGGNGINKLYGGGGGDTIDGRGGADSIYGQGGDDILTGGGGLDRFLFATGGGSDRVTDFKDGTDLLSFKGFGASFDTAAELIAAAIEDSGDAVITVPNAGGVGSTVVRLTSLALADLDASDFDSIIA